MCILLGLLALSAAPSLAEEEGALGLNQRLRDLSGDLRAVSLAARPGDEDLEVLALLRRGYGVETHVILATAGEAVGAVPVWGHAAADRRVRIGEARAAAHEVGASLQWLGLHDFGISRMGEEALQRWDRREAIRLLVVALRRIRPHLVFTDHRDAARRGAAEAAQTIVTEAIAAAADPRRFPDAGPLWTVSRVFTAVDDAGGAVRVDTGAVDLARGISYVTMAERARRAYVVVDPGRHDPAPPGPRWRHYRPVAPPGGAVDSLLAGLPVPRPEWLLPENLTGTREETLAALEALQDGPEEKRPPLLKMEAAFLAALNVELRLSPDDRMLTEEQPSAVDFSLVNGGTRTVRFLGIAMDRHLGVAIENPEVRPTELAPGEAVTGRFWVVPAAEAVGHQELRARATLAFGERAPMTALARGDFRVRESVEMSVEPWTRFIRPVDHTGVLYVVVTNHTGEAIDRPLRVGTSGTDRVQLDPPETVRVEPHASTLVPVQITLKDEVSEGLFGLDLEYHGHYHHDIFRIAEVNLPLEMRVGVVATETDAAFRALRALRILPVRLSDVDLQTADLTALDTIIIGERPFATRPVLKLVLPRLVEFVKGGGNIFLNYSRPEEWEGQALLPDLTFGTEQVTREDAELIVQQMSPRLLNIPNRIESEDFEGWVLERGRYFPAEFREDRYEVILKCADPGQPLQAALLVGHLGEGLVIQSSLTWRVQLENLNPGALKFLANLVTLPWQR